MFAFLLFPYLQQEVDIVFDNTLYLAQIHWAESAFARDPQRFEPKLGFITIFAHVDVRRFGAICHVKPKLISVRTQYDRHGKLRNNLMAEYTYYSASVIARAFLFLPEAIRSHGAGIASPPKGKSGGSQHLHRTQVQV
jgi:hypothetical protein